MFLYKKNNGLAVSAAAAAAADLSVPLLPILYHTYIGTTINLLCCGSRRVKRETPK